MQLIKWALRVCELARYRPCAVHLITPLAAQVCPRAAVSGSTHTHAELKHLNLLPIVH